MDSVKVVAGDLMEQVKAALSAEGTEFADMNWDTRNAERIMGLITPELLCQLEALRAQGFEEIWDNHLRELLNIENVLEVKSCEALQTDDLVAEFRAQGFEPCKESEAAMQGMAGLIISGQPMTQDAFQAHFKDHLEADRNYAQRGGRGWWLVHRTHTVAGIIDLLGGGDKAAASCALGFVLSWIMPRELKEDIALWTSAKVGRNLKLYGKACFVRWALVVKWVECGVSWRRIEHMLATFGFNTAGDNTAATRAYYDSCLDLKNQHGDGWKRVLYASKKQDQVRVEDFLGPTAGWNKGPGCRKRMQMQLHHLLKLSPQLDPEFGKMVAKAASAIDNHCLACSQAGRKSSGGGAPPGNQNAKGNTTSRNAKSHKGNQYAVGRRSSGPRKCRICGEVGHYAKSCPKTKMGGLKPISSIFKKACR
jgi:hypothetical protein